MSVSKKYPSLCIAALLLFSGLASIYLMTSPARAAPVTPTSPASGDILTGSVVFQCTSNAAVSVELLIDGVKIATMSGGPPAWSYEINTNGWTDGPHIIRYDSFGGGSDDVASVPVKFDNSGPAISNATTLYPPGQLHTKPGDQVTIRARVVESVSTLDTVTCDASMIGGGSGLLMYDDGQHNDGAPNDDVFGTEPVNVTVGGGYRAAYVLAADTQGNIKNVTAACNVDQYEPTILEIATMLPAGQSAVKNGDEVRVTAKVYDYKILIEHQVERKPLDVVLVLDNSGSMGGSNGSGGMRWDDLEYASRTFIDSLSENDRCAIVAFDLQGGWPFEDPRQYSTFMTMSETYNDPNGGGFTSTGRNVSKHIITTDDGMHLTRANGGPGCNTPIWDSIGTAIQYAINNRRASAVPVVVAMTDGDDIVGGAGPETGSETYCPGSPNGETSRTWAVSGGCIWDSPIRTYPSIERERDTDPFNQKTTITFNPGQPERTRTGLLNASIPVFNIGLGISPQGSNATAGNYLDPSRTSYRYTTEFDLFNIANSSVGGKYYFAPSSTDLYEIYNDVSQEIQAFGTSTLGIEQPKGIGSMQTDFTSIGMALMVNMFDDGLHADGKTEDGIYGSDTVTVNSLDTGNIVFLVEGSDKAGNVNSTQYTIKLDNIQPSVSWVNTSYPPGRDRAQDGYSIFVVANCSDAETGLGHVYLDASKIGGSTQVPMRDDGGGNDAVAFDGDYSSENVTIATGLVSGVYTYSVNAYDDASNMGSQSGNIEIFNDVDIIMENVANGDTLSGNYGIVANITDPDGIPDGAANPRYRIDANAWFDMSLLAGTRFGATVDTQLYSDGEHILYVCAEDPYGAESTLERTIIVDNTGPREVSLATPIGNEYIENIYSFRVTAVDAIGMDHVNLTINNDTWAEPVANTSLGYNADSGYYEMSLATSNLPDGTYRASAYAWDEAGHTKASAVRVFHVDNHAPSMSIVEPRDGGIVSGKVRMNISVQEAFLDVLEYNVDSAGWVANGTVWDTIKIADGSHSIRIRARDRAGHETSELITVTVDNHHPECRLSLPARAQFISGIYTLGAIVSDEVGLRSVGIVINNTGTGTEVLDGTMSYNAGTGYYEIIFDTTGVPDGNYSAVVNATDLAGNLTTAMAIEFQVDNNAPSLSVLFPKEGDVVSGAVRINVTVTDEPFLKTLKYNVDSAGWINMTVAWNTSAMEDGDHIIELKGIDLAGHETTGRIKVTVDNNYPEAHIISPASEEYVTGSYVFKISGADEVGIEGVVIRMFSENLTATYNTRTSCYEVVVDTGIWGDGTDFISADITDISGKSVSVGPRRFHVDNHVPEFDIHSPGDGDFVSRTLNVSLDVKDNFATLCRSEYNVDGKGWMSLLEDPPNSFFGYTRFSGLWNTMSLSEGMHSVALRVTDLAGHVTSYTISVFVDNEAPICEIHSPRENQYMEGMVTFRVKAEDSVGIKRVVLTLFGMEINASLNAQSGYYEYGMDTTVILEDGPRTITARAYDSSMKSTADGPVSFNLDNSHPKLVIDSPRSGWTLNGTVVINATNLDTHPLPTEYNVDSSGWHDIGVPWDTTETSDGTHTVSIRARDAIGHEVTETIMLTVDNHLPVCIMHVPAEGQFFEDFMTFKVLATDSLGIETIRLFIFAGSPYERTVNAIHNSVTNYYEYTLSLGGVLDGTYKARVAAFDLSGNSVVLDSVGFRVDSNPPSLWIRMPVNGEYLSKRSGINVTSNDAFEVSKEYNVDRGGWITISDTEPTLWDTTDYPDGPHSIEIRSTDEAGHVTRRDLTVYVDNSLPLLNVVNPGRDDHLTGVNTLKVFCYDAIAVESVEMKVDNGSLKTLYVNPVTGLYEALLDTSVYPDGRHTIMVTVRDRVGNSNTDVVGISFNNLGPEVALDGIPRKGSDQIDFRVDNTDNASRMFLNIDGTGWKEMGLDAVKDEFWYVWSTDTADNGKHTYQVKAVDEYGNERIMTGVVEVDNGVSFIEGFSNALPLILFILLLLFIVLVVLILVRTGHAKKWMFGDGQKEKKKDASSSDRKAEKKKGEGKSKPKKGAEIEDIPLKKEELPDIGEEGEFECPDCGAGLRAEDTVCPDCGAEFEDEDEDDGMDEDVESDGYEDRDPGERGDEWIVSKEPVERAPKDGKPGRDRRPGAVGRKKGGKGKRPYSPEGSRKGSYREAADEVDLVSGWIDDGMDVKTTRKTRDDIDVRGGISAWSKKGRYGAAAEDMEDIGGWIEDDEFYE